MRLPDDNFRDTHIPIYRKKSIVDTDYDKWRYHYINKQRNLLQLINIQHGCFLLRLCLVGGYAGFDIVKYPNRAVTDIQNEVA